MTSNLPPFLESLPRLPWQGPSTIPPRYLNAAFRHKCIPSSAHVLWWPSTSPCGTCLIFISGNPGLLDFYTPFLDAVYEKCGQSICILAHSFIGHTPGLDADPMATVSLTAQVEAVIELIDTIKSSYARIVLVGHSVGAWVVLQVLKARQDVIDSVVLLFPTIRHIVKTPNGKQLSWAFGGPFPRLISWMSVATRLLPLRALKYLFSDWPDPQLAVLRGLLDSPSTIHASLTMAHDEMQLITDLDVELIRQNRHIIHMYLAEVDKWVGENRAAILEVFHSDEGNLRIVHGPEDIPHAFCIKHGEQLAQQCYKWLEESGMLSTTKRQ